MTDDQTFDVAPDEIAVACDLQASRDTHRIEITIHRCGQSSAAYEETYRGQTLIESSREPLFDSCRVLVNMGLKGRLEMWGGEPYPRMIVRDIEQAARLTVVENVNGGPRFGRYRPHPGIIDGDDVDDAD
jgi:hypothetical protein